MNKFSGIDLHSNNSVVVVNDEADRVLYQRRLPNDAVQIRAALAPHREDLVLFSEDDCTTSFDGTTVCTGLLSIR
jgi:hypothetical protein